MARIEIKAYGNAGLICQETATCEEDDAEAIVQKLKDQIAQQKAPEQPKTDE